MDSITKCKIDNLVGEIEALKEESKVCDEDERELIANDIRSLKKQVTELYINENKYNKINKNADYYKDKHDKKFTESKRLNEFLDDDEILFYNDNDDLDIDFDYDDDDTFYEGGNEYRWTENGLTYQECINGTCWEAREAYNVDNGELVYFVVDSDTGDIDWECGTPDEAIDFIQAKYDDIYDDDEYYIDDIDEDEYYDYFTREDEAYDYRSRNSIKPFTVSYAKGDYVGTCIVSAKSKDDAEKRFYNRLGEYGYSVISVRNGNLMPEAPSLGMLADEVMYDDYDDYDELDLDYEATNVGSIGQHKRSSIDLINPDDEDISRFDIDDEEDSDEILLEITEDGILNAIDLADEFMYDDDEFVEIDDSGIENDTNSDINDSDDTDELELDDTKKDIVTTGDNANIDGEDSTSPMNNNKPKRTGSNQIDI